MSNGILSQGDFLPSKIMLSWFIHPGESGKAIGIELILGVILKAILKVMMASGLLLLASGGQVWAAALAANLHSVSGMGNAYAGSATGRHDNSDMFTNPAIISQIKRRQLSLSSSYLAVDVEAEASSVSIAGVSQSGRRHDSPGEDALVPALYFSTPISAKWSLGVNSNTPFGLASQYKRDWLGRFHALKSEVSSINLNPVLSYQIHDQWSVGAGLQIQRIDLTTSKTLFDGLQAEYQGDDWGYGYSLGLLYHASPRLDLGMGYRSKISHDLSGDVEFSAILHSTFAAKVRFTTPEILTVGLAYALSEQWEIIIDAKWTRWSRIKTLHIRSEDAAHSDSITPFALRNSGLTSLGANYQLNHQWLIRLGAAYEEGAVTNKRRNPQLPTGARIWLSAGFEYQLTDAAKVDFAYVHQFFNNTKSAIVENNAVFPAAASLEAEYALAVDVFALGVSLHF